MVQENGGRGKRKKRKRMLLLFVYIKYMCLRVAAIRCSMEKKASTEEEKKYLIKMQAIEWRIARGTHSSTQNNG